MQLNSRKAAIHTLIRANPSICSKKQVRRNKGTKARGKAVLVTTTSTARISTRRTGQIYYSLKHLSHLAKEDLRSRKLLVVGGRQLMNNMVCEVVCRLKWPTRSSPRKIKTTTKIARTNTVKTMVETSSKDHLPQRWIIWWLQRMICRAKVWTNWAAMAVATTNVWRPTRAIMWCSSIQVMTLMRWVRRRPCSRRNTVIKGYRRRFHRRQEPPQMPPCPNGSTFSPSRSTPPSNKNQSTQWSVTLATLKATRWVLVRA